MARTPASDPITDALDAAEAKGNNGFLLKLDKLTPEQQDAVIRARGRGLGYSTIADLLTKKGFVVGDSAVKTWLSRRGID
jgi:DNA-directed RNA polymerase specialized sigma24 family protein